MATRYFIYLTEEAWTEVWEHGGRVPLNPASAYLASERRGTKTPDEGRIRTIEGMPDWVVEGPNRFFNIQGDAAGISVSNMGFEHYRGEPARVEHGRAETVASDGIILCLSTQLSQAIGTRLGKKACVEIMSLDHLVKVLNQRIGIECLRDKVCYTDGFARNHFLKSREDEWQHEYRLFWPVTFVISRDVELPSGIGKRVFW